MKILINGLTQRPGGGMVILEGLVHGLAQASNQVRVLVLVQDFRVYETLARAGLDRVEVLRIPESTSLVDKSLITQRVRKAAVTHDCDVLIGLNFYLKSISIPQIIYHVDLERFEAHPVFPPTIGNLLEKARDYRAKLALIHADANVFESKYLRKTAENFHGIPVSRPSVIYIGINDASIDFKDNYCDIDEGLIVAVTNPQPYKNNRALVPLLKELVLKEPDIDWRVRIFGGLNQDAWKPLIDFAEEQGVASCLEFLGYQTRDVLNESLDKAVCQLTTSRLESFCMVALEAIARGCPVIVSADAAMPESVGNVGFVIEPDDSRTVAIQIVKLNTDHGLRSDLGCQSQLWAKKLTWSSSGKAFYDLCTEVKATS